MADWRDIERTDHLSTWKTIRELQRDAERTQAEDRKRLQPENFALPSEARTPQ
jgi:hypothetical protein